jgi:hypothetical protein
MDLITDGDSFNAVFNDFRINDYPQDNKIDIYMMLGTDVEFYFEGKNNVNIRYYLA